MSAKSRPWKGLLVSAVAVVALALFSLSASASAATPAATSSVAWWHVNLGVAPTQLQPGQQGLVFAIVSNLGYQSVEASPTAPIRVTDTLPAGLKVASGGANLFAYHGLQGRNIGGGNSTACQVSGGEPEVVTCENPRSIAPSESFEVVARVEVPTGASTFTENKVAVTGGTTGSGAEAAEVGSASKSAPVQPAAPNTTFGVEKYELASENQTGAAETQAGAHPFQLTTTLNLRDTLEYEHQHLQLEEADPAPLRDLHFTLPPGLLGNITVMAQCTSLQFNTINEGDSNDCPASTAVGVASIKLREPSTYHGALTVTAPVFNLVPEAGEPARFGIEAAKVPVVLTTAVKTGSNYAVEVSVDEATTTASVLDSQVTFWGVPADARHNSSRGWACLEGGVLDQAIEPPPRCEDQQEREAEEKQRGLTPKAFLTLPTSCAAQPKTSVTAVSYPFHHLEKYGQEEVPSGETEVASGSGEFELPALKGCSLLNFEPTFNLTPESSAANTPTGMAVAIKLPQASTVSPAEGATAEEDISQTTVALPEGLLASPAAANGLQACGSGGIGLLPNTALGDQLNNESFDPSEVECPASSKIGSATIETPLLKHSLEGSVYLASQDTNLAEQKLVLYLVAKDPESGVLVKLAGEVHVDPNTGRLTSTFYKTPPVPFSALTLNFFGGSRASQSTPPTCGGYSSVGSFTPSPGAPGEALSAVSRSSSFSITSGAGGAPCPSNPQPLSVAFNAGSSNTQAGAYTSFTLNVAHPDNDQPLSGLSTTLPPGVAAVLSSITPCEEPGFGQPWSCGAESLVGHALTSSGLGGEPFTLQGNVYLTAGYDGAPFGLLVATEAKAGPFNLGMVYVRSRLNVNPETAAVTVSTDAGPHGDTFPTFIKGIPVQLKQLSVSVDRPGFQFNPTSCAPMAVTGTLSGSHGASDPVSYPFQVANCTALPFKPKLTATAGGQASKSFGASLNVKIESAGLGQANIRKVDLTLPLVLPSRLSTLQKACLLAVFNANPAGCSGESIIGKAIIKTPILKNPLMGPAYLVSHGGAAFPDVEFVLQGEGITLVLDGKTDIKKGITYSRFEAAPDAPFSTFVTELPTGPHSVLTAYVPPSKHYSLCGTTLLMPTEITSQSGAVIRQTTNIVPTGCKGVASYKVSRAQRLAKALKACKKDKKKVKRQACERLARKHYGAKRATKKTKKK